jgi:hypothetical protein
MLAHRRLPGLLLGAIGLSSAVLLQPAPPGWCAEPRQQNLQGSWKLNADLTASLNRDQHAPAEREAAGRSRAGLGAMGPTGGPNDDLGLGDWSPAKERRDAEVRKQALAFLDSLTIVQQGSQVTITDQGGHARDLKTDGSKVRDQGPAGPALLRASWERDGSLAIDVKPDKGTRRTESYFVSNDGKHLYLTLAIAGQQDRLLRAYDLVPAPPLAPAPAPPSPVAPKPEATRPAAPGVPPPADAA